MSLFKRKPEKFFSPEENEKIVEAIRQAERITSGEVRVFVESRCRFVNPLDRASEIFYGLKMEQTELRNGVLIYVALRDKQLAMFADEGIYQKAGKEFWNDEVRTMLSHFNKENYADGLAKVIGDTGAVLATHFPVDVNKDKNELPDDIVFGR
ncbi:TPM domain-containing protein [Danxiaibacter flavus]|uniref:TPM domain-containing protein n=1 Tax=Danxiaibacter flavus TaxID=3049108 RepID=A0ABV3ZM59_9BACT|nr:TPM domain-containing protein [Chitinophagaceae bacterium DXS]